MTETYYLNGRAYTFETQEELDAWLLENPGASTVDNNVATQDATFVNPAIIPEIQENAPLSSSDFYSDVDFSTAYSSSTNLSTSAGDSSITLNSTAITAFGTDLLKLVVLQYGNDYANAGGMSDLTQKMNANFASGSSGYVPYIQFDAVVSGYGNDVSGVSSDDIASVNSVATANISQIIGV